MKLFGIEQKYFKAKMCCKWNQNIPNELKDVCDEILLCIEQKKVRQNLDRPKGLIDLWVAKYYFSLGIMILKGLIIALVSPFLLNPNQFSLVNKIWHL